MTASISCRWRYTRTDLRLAAGGGLQELTSDQLSAAGGGLQELTLDQLQVKVLQTETTRGQHRQSLIFKDATEFPVFGSATASLSHSLE
ncbi:hypothetical protein JOB18_043893 [Solea senegalensis]|uniref:Uncharacterized protein n=1 Tax=Solea senegalensis TaxID=28829 RepID=A0AAV6PHW3_SOLSE|nr:hypothetical protein JOB18_043893 [Solea senegalensis]